ncbi:hypothetical protein AB4Y85_00010 [Microvirga sp. 2YAF29]|uniref:hypothetical protein n=1 Tax=Microvirga sp. 2YAF29 TaxID=3233031 RepID=UPI003F947BA4
MTSDFESAGHERSLVSLLDLEQIKNAVNELRASSPRSVLADLVEEKIRKIENGHPAPMQEFPLHWERRAAS